MDDKTRIENLTNAIHTLLQYAESWQRSVAPRVKANIEAARALLKASE